MSDALHDPLLPDPDEDADQALVERIEANEAKAAAWQSLYRTDYGALVLIELRELCEATSSPFVAGDPYFTHVLIGRQDIWKRVLNKLGLTDESFVDSMVLRAKERHAKEKS